LVIETPGREKPMPNIQCPMPKNQAAALGQGLAACDHAGKFDCPPKGSA
jgi:hypothetical protein